MKNLLLYLLLIVSILPSRAQQLQWEPREDLNILLPESIRVYQTLGQLSDGAPIKAVYARVDLSDPNLKLRALGDNKIRLTTEEISERNDGILAINGGYFSGNASVSLLVSDGEVISPGLYPKVTKGGFALVDGEPQILWTNAKNATADPLVYLSPLMQNPGKELKASQAVGGGPVLLKNGEIKVTSKEEGFGGSHLIRHPRTAIGYSNDSTLIMMAVDGRQEASAGVTLEELAALMQDIGAVEAVNLDGGGSSAMVAADEVVNIPADIPNGNRNSLRRNASALVFSELQPRQEKEVYIFDTNSKNYSEEGLWKTTNQPNYYGQSLSRTSAAQLNYNKAVYSFDSLPRKEYQLGAWWAVNTDLNSERTAFVLHRGKNSDSIFVDQSSLQGSGRWNVLGNFILGEGDKLEIVGATEQGRTVSDAIRLVETTNAPELPIRGDVRIAVISDLNSGLGAADYEWQVDSIISRIPRLWQPDLVICGGDMVAGMGISDTATLRKMWKGFDNHIAEPLRKNNIPFGFTLGNHDGPRSYPLEQKIAREYWKNPGNHPGLQFVDSTYFPNYYSFVQDSIFFVSWEASSSEITEENLAWMKEQFNSPEAESSKMNFVMGHMPLYSVAQERDSRGNVLSQPEKLQALLEDYKVHTYISGHQHAYYPGKRGNLQLLNTGAAGSGPRSWLSIEKKPVNTITIMDIFFEQDSIAYTTYDIKERQAGQMALFNEKELPSAIFGVNGHVIRRDIPLTGKATGSFYPMDGTDVSLTNTTGSVCAEIRAGKLVIEGTYGNLPGKLVRKNPIKLHLGKNTEEGQWMEAVQVETKGTKKGRFKITLPADSDTKELLAVGALYVELNTRAGSFRAQLYPESNTAPQTPEIVSHNSRNIYGVRNIEALYELNWTKGTDLDGDFVNYTYQLASDSLFSNLVYEEATGRTTGLKKTETHWYSLLKTSQEGEEVIFYHRVFASDGKNISISPVKSFRLMKSTEPLTDFIEVPAPEFVYKGKISNAEGAGYGAEWDGEGKLWLADYRGRLTVLDSEGKEVSFSPLTSVEINAKEYDLSPINGIGVDLDGNILVGRNRNLLKIDAATGKGIAAWEVPEGERAITAPRAAENGLIYVMSLFADDPNYVLRQSTKEPSTFELVRTIELPGRILSRTFAMSSDGLHLYLPDPGSALIQHYVSNDGASYTKEKDIISTTSGSSGLHVTSEGSLYAAVRASGISPSTFHYRNERAQQMWTVELPEVNGAEPRGIGVSPDENTLIFCSYDKGGGFYLYERKP